MTPREKTVIPHTATSGDYCGELIDKMDTETLNTVYILISSTLAVMLSISELLAWSDCKANAITQLLRNRWDFPCINKVEKGVPQGPG